MEEKKPAFDPRLLDVPESFETQRLLIRAPRAGDGPEMNAAIHESLNELRPWMDWAKQAPSVEESESLARRCAAKFILREDLNLRGFLKGGGPFIIASGLHRINWDVPKFEIGYWLRTPYVGQGYATEAVRAISLFAFERLGAKRVEIRCDDRNGRSCAVAQRAGFVLEGIFRNDSRTNDGQLRDMRIYALTHPPE